MDSYAELKPETVRDVPERFVWDIVELDTQEGNDRARNVDLVPNWAASLPFHAVELVMTVCDAQPQPILPFRSPAIATNLVLVPALCSQAK